MKQFCIVKAFGLVSVWGPFKTFGYAKAHALKHLTNEEELMSGMYVILEMEPGP
jgi:hypothetical protein